MKTIFDLIDHAGSHTWFSDEKSEVDSQIKEGEISKNYDQTSKDVLAMENADTKNNFAPAMKMEDALIEDPVKVEVVVSAIDEVMKDKDDRYDGNPTREHPEIEPQLALTGEMDIGGLDH